MKLIVGLGNPGQQYQHNRHNVGCIMLDSFFGDFGEQKKFKALLSEDFLLPVSTQKVYGIKPLTYMNLSGESVLSLVSFYKLDATRDILIISDDIDMEFGKVRFRPKGSHGGQNGLRDIISRLSTDRISRIKIGIGRDTRYSVSDWVLSNFTPDERNILDTEVRQKVQDSITQWLGE